MSIRDKVLEVAAKEAKLGRLDGEELAFMASFNPGKEKHKISLVFTFEDEPILCGAGEVVKDCHYARDAIDNLDLDRLTVFLFENLSGFEALTSIEAGDAYQAVPDLKKKAEFYAEAVKLRTHIEEMFFQDNSFMQQMFHSWCANAANSAVERFESICQAAGLLPPNTQKGE